MRDNFSVMADIEDAVRSILKVVGEDVTREGLSATPQRAAKAWLEWTSGYDKDPREILKKFSNVAPSYDEMVFQGGIPFWSLCEHHLAPFFGVVHIGYIPNHNIVGLSKLSRLVDVFAKRLQVQERMTFQIVDALDRYLATRGAGVVVCARHACMESRGICKSGMVTTTSSLRGAIKEEDSARAEFLKFVSDAQNNGAF